MSDNNLVHLGDVTTPINTLIKKCSKAVGALWEPRQIVRVAKAKAKAALIEEKSRIEISELQRRALDRFFFEESRNQDNIERIASIAFKKLSPEVSSETVEKLDDDWISNFFDKCKLISHEEMQQLWGRILAGEAGNPGSFSKRTINFVSSLDTSDAILFTKLCSFVWSIEDDLVPLVFDLRNDIYSRNKIYFFELKHLQEIGLISFDNLAGFQLERLPGIITARYFDDEVKIQFPS